MAIRTLPWFLVAGDVFAKIRGEFGNRGLGVFLTPPPTIFSPQLAAYTGGIGTGGPQGLAAFPGLCGI